MSRGKSRKSQKPGWISVLAVALLFSASPLLFSQDQIQADPQESVARDNNDAKDIIENPEPSESLETKEVQSSSDTDSDTGLVVRLAFGKGTNTGGQNNLVYALRYQQYPGLVAAFLYLIRQEEQLYQKVRYASKSQGVYGNAFTSLPNAEGIYSQPNTVSVPHPEPGLAFWRNGSVLRSDILVLSNTKVEMRDQNNSVFFADLLTEQSRLPSRVSPKQGLRFVSVEANDPVAEDYLASISGDREAYLNSLEQYWQNKIKDQWPDLAALLQQGEDWQRNEFGYYFRTIQQGKGALPKVGEDLNVVLERKAFGGLRPQNSPVIISFGKDALPMPFSYFVGKTAKGSRVEILCPPSATRSNLSNLPAEYGGTRYQWLLDSFAGEDWVHLGFALEVR
ncbi:hypothetical protein P0082_10920 [Candidatus Haliotispira prima]|uniref:Uncharacterized protein n=1 Tax=Candidatus Haliotispira prima TaxID=3034016 RepID=A0ABY8MGJ1_9SPIO|nr:hypothetical protein P0082_10920 [Candidatus Haliotispira prima]